MGFKEERLSELTVWKYLFYMQRRLAEGYKKYKKDSIVGLANIVLEVS